MRDGFGEVFPPLPQALLGASESSGESSDGASNSGNQLRGQDLNLRPSGYENAEGAAIIANLQRIVGIDASHGDIVPLQNPAIPRGPEASDDSPDDSVLEHVRGLAMAAHALVAVDPERARELLQELMRLLEAQQAVRVIRDSARPMQ